MHGLMREGRISCSLLYPIFPNLPFSDVVMPGAINGIEMAEQILKLKPAIPILLASGYTEKSLKDQILEFSNVVFVSKPYDTDEIPGLMHSMMLGQQV